LFAVIEVHLDETAEHLPARLSPSAPPECHFG
jgi:hypothetical protein